MINSQCLLCLVSLCSSINFTAKLCSCTSDCGEQSCCTTGTYIRARNMNYITMIYNYSHFRSCTTNKYQLYLYMSFSLEKQSCQLIFIHNYVVEHKDSSYYSGQWQPEPQQWDHHAATPTTIIFPRFSSFVTTLPISRNQSYTYISSEH